MDKELTDNYIKWLNKNLRFFMLMFAFVVVALVVNAIMFIHRTAEIRGDLNRAEARYEDMRKIQSEVLRELGETKEHNRQLIEQQKKDAETIRQLQSRATNSVAPVKQGIPKTPINSGGGVVKASYYDYNRIAGYPGFTGHTHLTAASRDYPKGTKLRVCRADDQSRCVDVLVNDWVNNPKVAIDLSKLAFSQLSPLSRGIIEVTITKL